MRDSFGFCEFDMRNTILFILCTLLSGCAHIAFFDQQDNPVIRYHCDEGYLEVQRDDESKTISFSVDGQLLTLSQGLSSVGQRYSDGVYAFWSDGNNVTTIYQHDWIIRHNCVVEPEVEAEELTFREKLHKWFGSEHGPRTDLAQ